MANIYFSTFIIPQHLAVQVVIYLMQMLSIKTDDEQLWLLTRKGDERAFAVIVEKYKKLIYSLAYTALGDHQQSEEVVMDVFTFVWQSQARIELRLSLKAYIIQCTRNQVLLYLQHRTRHRHIELTDGSTIQDRAEIPNPDFLETILPMITQKRYRQDLELLLNGASYKEISLETGRSIKQVYKSMEKVVQFLRKKRIR